MSNQALCVAWLHGYNISALVKIPVTFVHVIVHKPIYVLVNYCDRNHWAYAASQNLELALKTLSNLTFKVKSNQI